MRAVYVLLLFLMGVSALFGVGCTSIERREVSAAAATPSPLTSPAPLPAGTTIVEELASSSQARTYRLHLPVDYSPAHPAPLVINLHGYNSNASQEEQVSRMSEKADQVGFIVAYPQGLGDPPSWKFGSRPEAEADVQFIRDLVNDLQSKFNINANEIYVTGISNGAEMSYRLACDMADTFAAVGLVSGGYPPFQDCQPARPVPVVVFHGTADRLLPYEGHPPLLLPVRQSAMGWAARNGCSPTPRVTFQNGDVTGETWSNCRENAEVVLYTIAGKGHSWPGSNMPAAITTHDIVATDAMWQFFVEHPLTVKSFCTEAASCHTSPRKPRACSSFASCSLPALNRRCDQKDEHVPRRVADDQRAGRYA